MNCVHVTHRVVYGADALSKSDILNDITLHPCNWVFTMTSINLWLLFCFTNITKKLIIMFTVISKHTLLLKHILIQDQYIILFRLPLRVVTWLNCGLEVVWSLADRYTSQCTINCHCANMRNHLQTSLVSRVFTRFPLQ